MVWDFIADADNQKTLSFLGGGLVIVVSGLWTAFLVLRKKPDEPDPTPTNSIQSGDGVTATGDVLIEGGVSITKTETPRALYILAILGCGLIALGLALPGCDASDASGSVVACGDLTARDITIGTPTEAAD